MHLAVYGISLRSQTSSGSRIISTCELSSVCELSSTPLGVSDTASAVVVSFVSETLSAASSTGPQAQSDTDSNTASSTAFFLLFFILSFSLFFLFCLPYKSLKSTLAPVKALSIIILAHSESETALLQVIMAFCMQSPKTM